MKKYIVSLLILCSCNFLFAQPGKIKLTGSGNFSIGIADTIQSLILSEKRVINISLPEDYSPDSANTYPVIYLLDGAADEDFIHVAGLVRYYTTSWVNRFPQSIVVGIANVNRRRDFTFATPDLDFVTKIGFDTTAFKQHGGSEKFMAFIEKELQPFIESNFKTNHSKTIIGESLGGLLATEILLKKPILFDTYIIITPSLWWGNESLLKEKNQLLQSKLSTSLKVYIGAANKAEDLRMYNDAVQLASKLKTYRQLKVYYDYLPEETHASIIHLALYNAFKKLYPLSNAKH